MRSGQKPEAKMIEPQRKQPNSRHETLLVVETRFFVENIVKSEMLHVDFGPPTDVTTIATTAAYTVVIAQSDGQVLPVYAPHDGANDNRQSSVEGRGGGLGAGWKLLLIQTNRVSPKPRTLPDIFVKKKM